MRIDKNLNPIYTEQEAVKVLLNDVQPWDFCVEGRNDIFKASTEDEYRTTEWWMPNEYKNIDIEHFLLECRSHTDTERERIIQEYENRGMVIVLKFLKYLVDVCNENNIVLGVGRGSSVASYCLYLLGVHRIDSIKYKLDIKEFLK